MEIKWSELEYLSNTVKNPNIIIKCIVKPLNRTPFMAFCIKKPAIFGSKFYFYC